MATITIDPEGNIEENANDGGEPPEPKMSLGFTKSTMDIYEFLDRIPNEEAATAFVEEVRWGDGVYCPHCTSENVFRVKSGKPMSHRCRSCGKHFGVKTNSVFHETGIPFKKWLHAIYLFHTSRAGVSSHELSRVLGITQKTAWFMGHRIRKGNDPERRSSSPAR